MFNMTRRFFGACACVLALPGVLAAAELQESLFWQAEVDQGDLPPVADRLPDQPFVVDLAAKGRVTGQQGGTLKTFVTRSKDIRQMVVYGYARLVGYDYDYTLMPDLL
ncbi:MAG: peptide/nickel transport system substrate-binding protein, partial [Paracoccaceae bacterium]